VAKEDSTACVVARCLIRYSNVDDEAALARLAALDSRRLPEGSFLLAEIDGELVAAAPLDVDAEFLKDPFRRTANVRELLTLRAGRVRRHRKVLQHSAQSVHRALPDTAGSRFGNRYPQAES
jgi:hypothetical protein